jgi:hypothetical protein
MKTLICICVFLLFITVSKPTTNPIIRQSPIIMLNPPDSLLKAVERLDQNTRKLEKYTK